ncbi:MAG: GGDEF domain-containing protein, partial [Lachnospiraceae bacterium]
DEREHTEKPTDQKDKKRKKFRLSMSVPAADTNKMQAGSAILQQDLGILMFLLGLLGAAVIVSFSSTNELRMQNIILMLVLVAVGMLAMMRAGTAAVIAAALEILFFTIYKLFTYAESEAVIEKSAYLWPVIIIVTVGGALLFINRYARVEQINAILNERIGELTVNDPLTGLQNLRGLYAALSRLMSTAKRHEGMAFGLIMIRLRYSDEIRQVLTKEEFDRVRIRIAQVIENTLRLEDEMFTVDDEGSVAVICIADEKGTEVVKGRLISALTADDAFPTIRERTLRLDFSTVYRMYDRELNHDAMKYVELVDREFAYEV